MTRKLVISVLIIIVLLILLFVLSELLIPPLAGRYLRREILKRFPEARISKLRVDAFPAFKLLSRSFDSLHLEVNNIDIKGAHFETVRLRSSDGETAQLEASFNEEQLNNLFQFSNPRLTNISISLGESLLNIHGSIDLGAASAAISTSGNLEVKEGRQIYFVPTSIDLGTTGVPGLAVELAQQLIGEEPVYILKEEYPFTLNNIMVREGRLVIEGEVEIDEAIELFETGQV